MDNPYKSIVNIPSLGLCVQKIILEPSQPSILTRTKLIHLDAARVQCRHVEIVYVAPCIGSRNSTLGPKFHISCVEDVSIKKVPLLGLEEIGVLHYAVLPTKVHVECPDDGFQINYVFALLLQGLVHYKCNQYVEETICVYHSKEVI